MENSRQEIRKRLQKIIEAQGHGLPSSAEAIGQCDHWAEAAPFILEEICDEFNLYREPTDD